jgi:putative MATE family efflux protein
MAMKRKKKTLVDMTQGSVMVTLIEFSLPLMAGSIFQLLYSTTDIIFVGNFIGVPAAAAVGASSLLVTCLIGIFTGLSAGTSVAISHAEGGKKAEEVNGLAQTAMGFAALLGLVLTIIGELVAPSILAFMNTPGEILEDATVYIRIYFLSLLPLILYNIGSGVLRACGDSVSPFYILAIGGILNVIADALLIVVFQLGILGAAIATSISQTFSAVAVLWILIRGNEKIKLIFSIVKMQGKYIWRILKLGLPAGIQSMTITLSNVILQYYINGFGTDTITAYTYYFKLESFIYLPVLAFGQAAMTFTAQNVGAGKLDRIKKGIFSSAMISVFTVATISTILLAIGETALGWFGKDKSVIEIGLKVIAITFPLYWLNSLIEVFSGAIRGMGYAFLSMIIIICVICGGRVLLLKFLVNRYHNVTVLTSVYPITWALAMASLFLGMVLVWKRIKSANISKS